jgi:bifunctional DNA-binding transcriptional regulator/antitoxin component of YhaV-PrlF toxin-antitoxin module
MIVSLDAKRRLTVPVALVTTSPGDSFEVRFDPEEDTIIFRRVAAKSDWMTVLRECPVSMDDLPPRRRELPRRRKL